MGLWVMSFFVLFCFLKIDLPIKKERGKKGLKLLYSLSKIIHPHCNSKMAEVCVIKLRSTQPKALN